ncbi:MAG TPA: SLBB domain-containing protein [Ignavibacteriales bacterium]|nr:SLBB domain-containing protein [Ignavibacteriales bacterium]
MRKHLALMVFCLLFFGFLKIQAQSLNPGDGVRLAFFNITDKISGDYFITQDRMLQLPFIGTLQTENITFENLKKEIISKYDSLYRQPEVSVRPLYRINVLGEVKTPGSYYATGVEKISDLLALAGGETSDADLGDIYIVRNDREIKIDAAKIIEEGENKNDISLTSGDRLYVPRKWWVGARNIAMIVSGAGILVTLVALFVRK